MTDIVERLRDSATPHRYDLMDEAAAEIERLKNENAELQRELRDTLLGPTMVQNLRADNVRLRARETLLDSVIQRQTLALMQIVANDGHAHMYRRIAREALAQS